MATLALTEPKKATTCPRCRGGQEVYLYMRNQFEFNVERARGIVKDGREPVEVDDESVQTAIERSEIFEQHIHHVNPSIPGIISHVFYRTEAGEMITAQLLIDGHHRAARCLRDELPFFAYLLTEEESRAILVRSPDKPGRSLLDMPKEDVHEPDVDLHPETTEAYQQKYATSLPFSLRARQVIAGATTHDRRGFGPFGVYIDHAEGARKWDLAGNAIIDYWMGHGALLCGHGYRPVVDAVAQQVLRGTHFGACHPMEVRWAELVSQMIPSAERVRFTASGTEATLLAMRIARAYTGRQKIIKFEGHFHGWHDEAMAHFFDQATAGFNAGAVESIAVASAVNVDQVLGWIDAGDVAGVILEPGGGGSGGLPWSRSFLQSLRDATRRQDTVLIYDEVITGFRHTTGGVQKDTGILPDVTTLAKILAGGLPGGAVVGRADVMAVFGNGVQRGERFAQIPHTGTFNANPLSAAAGIALLEHIQDGVAQEKAKHAADCLVEGVNELADEHGADVFFYTNGTSVYHILIGARQDGMPLAPSVAVTPLYRARTRQYALLRRALLVEGVDTHPLHGWVSAVHDDRVLDETLQAFDRAFHRIRNVEGFRRQ